MPAPITASSNVAISFLPHHTRPLAGAWTAAPRATWTADTLVLSLPRSPLTDLFASAEAAAERGDVVGLQTAITQAIALQQVGSTADRDRVLDELDAIQSRNPALVRTAEGRIALDQLRVLSNDRAQTPGVA